MLDTASKEQKIGFLFIKQCNSDHHQRAHCSEPVLISPVVRQERGKDIGVRDPSEQTVFGVDPGS